MGVDAGRDGFGSWRLSSSPPQCPPPGRRRFVGCRLFLFAHVNYIPALIQSNMISRQ